MVSQITLRASRASNLQIAPSSQGRGSVTEDPEEIERRIAELLKKAIHEENRERLGEILDKIRHWIAVLQRKNDPPPK